MLHISDTTCLILINLCSSTNVVKTTMTVRLHSAKVEDPLQEEERQEERQEETGEATPWLGLTVRSCHLQIRGQRPRSLNLVTIGHLHLDLDSIIYRYTTSDNISLVNISSNIHIELYF